MTGSSLSIRYSAKAAVVAGSIMATPPAGSSGLNVVCFGLLEVVLLLPSLDPVAVAEVLPLSSSSSLLLLSSFSSVGVCVARDVVVVLVGPSSTGVLAGEGVLVG